jgi:hypothetical protein
MEWHRRRFLFKPFGIDLDVGHSGITAAFICASAEGHQGNLAQDIRST